MKHFFLLVSCLLGWTLAFAAEEKTEVTAQYVTNASFEGDDLSTLSVKTVQDDGLRGYIVASPKGWTVTNDANAVSLLVTNDCFTDNNFGKVTTLADGNQAYYLRMGWSGGSTSVRQTLNALPKGKYQLVASVRSAYANSATSTLDLVAGSQKTTEAFAQGSTGCFLTMEWADLAVNFELTEDGNAQVGFDVTWLSGGSCIMFDNVRLYRLSDDYVEPEDPTEQDVESPTEGVVKGDFVAEPQMKSDLLQMLANFATYL